MEFAGAVEAGLPRRWRNMEMSVAELIPLGRDVCLRAQTKHAQGKQSELAQCSAAILSPLGPNFRRPAKFANSERRSLLAPRPEQDGVETIAFIIFQALPRRSRPPLIQAAFCCLAQFPAARKLRDLSLAERTERVARSFSLLAARQPASRPADQLKAKRAPGRPLDRPMIDSGAQLNRLCLRWARE